MRLNHPNQRCGRLIPLCETRGTEYSLFPPGRWRKVLRSFPFLFFFSALLPGLIGTIPFFVLTSAFAAASPSGEWPSGFVVHDGTESPNGRYAIIVPPQETDSGQDADCFLADIQAHRVVGKLDTVDYFEHQNHADLLAVWSADSARCVVTREGRFGFDTITLVELEGQNFRQVDLGQTVERSLDPVTAKEAARDRVENPGGPIAAYMRFTREGRIQFRAVSTSNPKQLDDVRTYCALFQGTYDPDAGRWTVIDARPISAQMFDILSDAYANSASDKTTASGTDQASIQFGSQQEEAEFYDRELNEVYSALRFILPKNEFEKVKAEQIAWLKQRDAAPSLREKNARVRARIKALGEFLW